MSQLNIADLNFFEAADIEKYALKGSGNIVPDNLISTDIATGLDVSNMTGLSIGGDVVQGFKIGLLATRGAAAGAGAALALNGKAKATVKAKNNQIF